MAKIWCDLIRSMASKFTVSSLIEANRRLMSVRQLAAGGRKELAELPVEKSNRKGAVCFTDVTPTG
jgi:hypothetical protein